jgi:mannonate dehydratase
VAQTLGLRLAPHADNPPRKLFGLPRILKNVEEHRRLLDIIVHPASGLTLCTGSLGCDRRNDVPAMVNEFAARGRVHFVYFRNVKVSDNGDLLSRRIPAPAARGIWARLWPLYMTQTSKVICKRQLWAVLTLIQQGF